MVSLSFSQDEKTNNVLQRRTNENSFNALVFVMARFA
jgi:hypothetical protein